MQSIEWEIPDILTDINGNDDIYHDGNRNLKGAGVQLPYTEEHIAEFIKCKNDIEYFAERYYHIRDLDKGIIKIKLRDYQKKMLKSFVENRNTIVNATRQCVAYDTKVNVRDSDTKEIFEIEIGKLFDNFDINKKPEEIKYNTDNFEVFSDCGWTDFQGVYKTELQESVKVNFYSGMSIECSLDHEFIAYEYSKEHEYGSYRYKTIKACELQENDRIFSDQKHGNLTVKNVVRVKNQIHYSIYMSGNEHYFANGALSLNCGKSTSFEIFCCHYVLFQEQKTIAILANKAMSANNILRKVKVAYELLPKWLQSGIKVWNNSQIILENGCNILAGATSSSAVRSMAINVLIIDEMAFISNNLWTEFYSSVYPTVSSSKESKTILVSTPNGMNHFYRYWVGATTDDPKLKNSFNPIIVHWSEVPGRDEQWYKTTLSNMTEEEFNREFEGDFLGSSLTLLSVNALKTMKIKPQVKDPKLDVQLADKSRFLRMYKKVQKNHRYIMSVDSAKVREDTNGDPVAIQIIDITRYPFKQVAVFQATNGMHYLQIPEVAYIIGKYYNWAYAFVENNEIGQEIVDSLAYDFEYENVFYEKGNLAGYRTTKKTKRLGCSNLKGWIESGKLQVCDPLTIEEFSTFVKKKNGTFSAEEGYHDDLVMALMGCLFFTTRPEFDTFTDMKSVSELLFNEGKKKVIEQEIDQDMPAFGVIDVDGVDAFDELSVF